MSLRYAFIFLLFLGLNLSSADAQTPPSLPDLPALPGIPALSETKTQPAAPSPTPQEAKAAPAKEPTPALPDLSALTPPTKPAATPPIVVAAEKPVIPQLKPNNTFPELALPALPGSTPNFPEPVQTASTSPVKPAASSENQSLFDSMLHPKSVQPANVVVETKSATAKTVKSHKKVSAKRKRVPNTASIARGRSYAFHYRSQILPPELYARDYDRFNKHLPKATYPQDLDALLFVTAARDDIDGMRALLNAGRSMNTRNVNGETPLIVAVRYNAINVVRLLLARGADGDTALRYASTYTMQTALRARS